mmetsp:Transcript_72883/g.144856  ORF Transcript_72883/g.144856 Transcript_72883/m.144856 type:complete len:207 (+) Transcript_72883:1175-1795(+)
MRSPSFRCVEYVAARCVSARIAAAYGASLVPASLLSQKRRGRLATPPKWCGRSALNAATLSAQTTSSAPWTSRMRGMMSERNSRLVISSSTIARTTLDLLCSWSGGRTLTMTAWVRLTPSCTTAESAVKRTAALIRAAKRRLSWSNRRIAKLQYSASSLAKGWHSDGWWVWWSSLRKHLSRKLRISCSKPSAALVRTSIQSVVRLE